MEPFYTRVCTISYIGSISTSTGLDNRLHIRTWNRLLLVYMLFSKTMDWISVTLFPIGAISRISFSRGVGNAATVQLNVDGCPGFTLVLPKWIIRGLVTVKYHSYIYNHLTSQNGSTAICETTNHYENMPMQICRKFHLQKLKIFR